MWENCLYSVNHVLNKTLIGQAGGVGGKTRQEVEMMQGEQENSGEEEVDSPTPTQITEAAGCELPH